MLHLLVGLQKKFYEIAWLQQFNLIKLNKMHDNEGCVLSLLGASHRNKSITLLQFLDDEWQVTCVLP